MMSLTLKVRVEAYSLDLTEGQPNRQYGIKYHLQRYFLEMVLESLYEK